VTKPKKPFTRSATKKQNLVDEIPGDETFPCLETKDVVEYKPPLGKKVRFSPKYLTNKRLTCM
jgi:hypothetical protein